MVSLHVAMPAVAAAIGSGSLLPNDATLRDMPAAAQIGAIILGTLISEDLVCIAVGMLIRREQISPWIGGLGCFLGIYIGDLLFFAIGRLGGMGVLRWKFFTRRLSPERLQAFGAWFDRRPWAAIAMCRVMPGIRVPLYLAVGALTKRTRAFFWWTCFFAFVWTPGLIGLVVLFGDVFVAPFERFIGGGWKPVALAIVAMYLIVRLAMLLATEAGRAKLLNRVGKLWGRKPIAVAEDPAPVSGSPSGAAD
ncbi:DedA family protein [Humisphaera borealis]|uniref:DedA family protein n=1 Tax=Humisphaera borealis TaxID=2807512 RepID=A0A7M2X2X8_9BACT|nr:DedA family protein [Humisphaera borealis]QOV92035.1 DedA family protein [Humisphaera borealis]